jgi:hypothetical protein
MLIALNKPPSLRKRSRFRPVIPMLGSEYNTTMTIENPDWCMSIGRKPSKLFCTPALSWLMEVLASGRI